MLSYQIKKQNVKSNDLKSLFYTPHVFFTQILNKKYHENSSPHNTRHIFCIMNVKPSDNGVKLDKMMIVTLMI